MEQNRSTLERLDSPGQVTTLYAYEGGPVRNGLLAAMALQLAGDADGAPVLVIDWDLASPSLHGYFGAPPGATDDNCPPGLVDYAERCSGSSGAAASPMTAAAMLLPMPCSTPSTGVATYSAWMAAAPCT